MTRPSWLSRLGTFLRNNRTSLSLCAVSVFCVLAFLVMFYRPPGWDIGPAQPIPFSHRLHAGDKAIACEFCHPYVGRSHFPGIPPVEKCLYCHNYIIANHPEIQKEHAYFDTDTPTPWVKVNYIPEHVFFNHQRHIRKQIQCESCHGKIERMDRIQGKQFKMGFCITCHQEKNARMDCWLACHN